jgi:hypothetical protein
MFSALVRVDIGRWLSRAQAEEMESLLAPLPVFKLGFEVRDVVGLLLVLVAGGTGAGVGVVERF